MAEENSNLSDDLENIPADMKIDDTILKLAEQYVGYENRAKQLNKDKAGVREQADKIGIPSLAWQIGVRMVKIMDLQERRDFERGFKRVTGVLSKNAETLFPEDLERQKKRKDKAKEKAAKAAAAAGKDTPEQQERRIAADNNPRSDPKSGGAGKPKPKGKAALAIEAAEAASAQRAKLQGLEAENGAKATMQPIDGQTETGDELITRVSAEMNAKMEQAEGEELLRDAGKPKSQSTIVQEKLAEAKLA